MVTNRLINTSEQLMPQLIITPWRLTLFFAMFPFWFPCKHQKTFGLQTSENIWFANIRKHLVFWCFQGDQKGTFGWKGIMKCSDHYSFCTFSQKCWKKAFSYWNIHFAAPLHRSFKCFKKDRIFSYFKFNDGSDISINIKLRTQSFDTNIIFVSYLLTQTSSRSGLY